MIRRIASWTLILVGGAYLVLLSALGCLEWFVNGTLIEVHTPLLVASLVILFVGVGLKEESKHTTSTFKRHRTMFGSYYTGIEHLSQEERERLDHKC